MWLVSCSPGKQSAPKVSLSYWISEGLTRSVWGTCRAQPLFVHGKHGVCIIKLFQGFIFPWLSFLQPETHWNHFRSGRQEFTKRSMPQTESLIPDKISTLSALEFSSSMPLCTSSPFLLLQSFFFWEGHMVDEGANWAAWWLGGRHWDVASHWPSSQTCTWRQLQSYQRRSTAETEKQFSTTCTYWRAHQPCCIETQFQVPNGTSSGGNDLQKPEITDKRTILNDSRHSQRVHGSWKACRSASSSLGLSAGHHGGSSTEASVIWLADQNLFISSVTETHLEERRFIWTPLSLQASQESYSQTGISCMPSG